MNLKLPKIIKSPISILVIIFLSGVSIAFGTISSEASSNSDLLDQENIIDSTKPQNSNLFIRLMDTAKNFGASVYSITEETKASTVAEAENPNTTAQYPAEILADSPYAYYRFGQSNSEIVADSSDQSRPMTLSGAYALNKPELLFNQTNNDKAVSVSNIDGSATGLANNLTATNGLTVSMMINFSAHKGGGIDEENIFYVNSGVNSLGLFGLAYFHNVRELKWLYNKADGSGMASVSAPFDAINGQTYHIAVTHNFSTKTVNIYVNGSLVKSSVEAYAPKPAVALKMYFAKNVQGIVDELAVFDTELSSGRIKAQFAASRGADASANVYYSAPNASIYGRGTVADPINFNAALESAFVDGGKILELLEGNYVGLVDIKHSGSPEARIKLRGQSGKRVTFDGAGLEGDVLRLSGSYIDVSGLEIRKTWNVRTSNIADTTGCQIPGTNGTVKGEGVFDAGGNNRVYNNIIHDILGDGINSGSEATNSEYYGNLIYNNGWLAPRTQGGAVEANGHAFYSHNEAPSTKKFRKNIVFNPYSAPMHLWGSTSARVENYSLEGNLYIGGGLFYIIGGGTSGANNVNLVRERTFKNEMQLGYGTSTGRTISLVDSYIYGKDLPLQIANFNSIVMTGNTLIGSGSSSSAIVGIKVKTAFTNSVVNNNTYYHNRPGVIQQFSAQNAIDFPLINTDFVNWKSATGWDINSTYIIDGSGLLAQNTKPTSNQVFIEPLNEFEANRSYVAVYNWSNASNQSIDLSSVMAVGTKYEIRSASNYYAGAILSGTYNGGAVTLPLTTSVGLPARVLPLGETDVNRWLEPAPNFAAFLIVPVGSSITTPTPTPTPTLTPTPTPPTPTPTLTPTPPTPTPTPTPTQANSAQFDFDGDRKADISVFRPSDSVWYILNSLDASLKSIQFGTVNDIPVPADYDGDGKMDIAVWREGDFSYFYILQSSTNSMNVVQFGTRGDNPSVVGDWDADGKADLAVYRDGRTVGQSYFFYRRSSLANVDFVSVPWGTNGDKPMRGDFDGDGKIDAAVFRPSNNIWYILQSSNNQMRYEQWGRATDQFVPADYDGDGKTDLAVYRDGVWYMNETTEGFKAVQFGIPTDNPVAADYDGDGKTDLAVYRDGVWYLQQSSSGFASVVFGLPSDKAIANFQTP